MTSAHFYLYLDLMKGVKGKGKEGRMEVEGVKKQREERREKTNVRIELQE